jgi:hypothetical protein
MENTTGRVSLLKRAEGYEDDLAAGLGFFDAMVQRCGLTLDVMRGALSDIPTRGPVILIANHPYGILDGLMLGHILSQTRGDFLAKRRIWRIIYCPSALPKTARHWR